MDAPIMTLAEAMLVPTFSRETFDEVIGDIKPLLPLHWEELAAYPDIPLAPDLDFYKRAGDAGALRFYTVRLGGGLMGYVIMTIVPHHPHYMGQPFAIADICWVHPDHRNFGVGTGLFDFMESDLKGFVVSVGDKITSPALGLLLKGRGYEPISVSYAKRL